MRTTCPRERGFTLIELLVVVAIIALLISILLPSLRCARESAKAAKCGAQLKNFGTSLAAYCSENKEWYPGINTTGFELKRLDPRTGATGFRRPGIPAQSYDWMTPLLRQDIPGGWKSRAEAFFMAQEQFKCPSQAQQSRIFDAQGLPSDIADFDELNDRERWTAVSYLMPVGFQFWGEELRSDPSNPNSGPIVGESERPGASIIAELHPTAFSVATGRFISRKDKVGTEARKIFAADGTRYLPASFVLDHDIAPTPGLFGSFTETGGWWGGSTGYGAAQGTAGWDPGTTVGYNQPGQGQNMAVSYRHGCTETGRLTRSVKDNKGSIEAVFFDGHVAKLGDRQSREIELWYPSGSKVRSNDSGLTFVENGFVIP